METRRTRLEVRGTSCADCAATVREALESLDGVEWATVNVAADTASATYDPDRDRLRHGRRHRGGRRDAAGDDPLDVVKAIRVSDVTLRRIRRNLARALGYNTLMIPLASLGLLQPVLAAAAMAFSDVSVLANSLLFGTYTPDHDYDPLGRLRGRVRSWLPSR